MIVILLIPTLVSSSSIYNCPSRVQALQNFVHCIPRQQLATIDTPQNLVKIQPRQVFINKCIGSCWAEAHTCGPDKVQNKTFLITGKISFPISIRSKYA